MKTHFYYLMTLLLCLSSFPLFAQTTAHALTGNTQGKVDESSIVVTPVYADAEGSSVYNIEVKEAIEQEVILLFRDDEGSMSITHKFSKLPQGFEYPLYLSGFPPGIYTVEVLTAGQVIRKRIQKKR